MDLGATICRPKSATCAASAPCNRLRRIRQRHSPTHSPAPKARRNGRINMAWPIGSNATARSGWSAGPPRAARRHGRASWQRMDGCRRQISIDRHRASRLHPFLARSAGRAPPGADGEGWWHPISELPQRRASDPLSSGGGDRALRSRSMRPETFFSRAWSGPRRRSARRTRENRRARKARRCARAPVERRPAGDGRDGTLVWQEVCEPELFLGFDGEAPRFSPLADPAAMAFSVLPLIAQLDARDAPVFAGGPEPRPVAFAPSFLRQLRARIRHRSRRLVATLHSLLGRALPARRSGGHHAGRA